MNILVINPGATSTKIALYNREENLLTETIQHRTSTIQSFSKVADQLDYRLEVIKETLDKHAVNFDEIVAIAARGGLLPPVESGAYEVNEAMLDFLVNRPRVEHASNLGAIIANKLLKLCPPEAKAYVYDPVTVDQFAPVSRISGLKGVERASIGHALNMRAVAFHVANQLGKAYEDCHLIVAHLGGGNTISVHQKGLMIDSLSDDEGPFSTERTGELPVKSVMKLCYKHSEKEMERLRRQVGGMYSYLGTNDARIVEERINEGDQEAALVFEALSYQVAKGIGSLATVLKGEVDGIILTGGLAYSTRLAESVREKVDFLGPFFVVPGEKEMYALASGVTRVLEGVETPHVFKVESGE